WSLKTPMPSGAKPIGDGGWLGWDYGTTQLFAARGNKQPDFFSYDVLGDSWTRKTDWPDGTEIKKPSKGAVGTAASDQDGTFFALKGNNTAAFWSYSIAPDSWKQLKDIPLGTSKKKVKGGSDLVFVPGATPEENFVYCLKGGKNEFYRYGVAADSWEELASVPAPAQKYDKGSWLCRADSLIFCHQAKYQTLMAYNLNTQAWGTALKPMPTLNSMGKKKKSKDGGAGALHAGFIYALKGGNTQEFWKYDVGADSWTEAETIPVGSLKKRVKGGGDVVALAQYASPALYAFKGNKTNELWLYTPPARVAQAQTPRVTQTQVQAQNRTELGSRKLAVLPNPLSHGHAVLHYSLPRAGKALVSIYDATGRAVFVRSLGVTRSGSTTLDLRGLSAGVYLARLESGSYSLTHKLVVEQ
ncbi:T9SS type A sorting domain-containing protein, partial [candidate division WOR-3 bacterium]|nr:T9SS type A sorting domain-containing protein [candidate division WOR-3 bacterium]